MKNSGISVPPYRDSARGHISAHRESWLVTLWSGTEFTQLLILFQKINIVTRRRVYENDEEKRLKRRMRVQRGCTSKEVPTGERKQNTGDKSGVCSTSSRHLGP